MVWNGIDQRKFPRVNYKCLIRVSNDGREEEIEAFTENVGAGGVCVVLEKAFERFETVTLEMDLGDGGPLIFCKGVVVWVVKRHPADKTETVKYDTGIEFSDMSDGNGHRISMVVENILRAQT